MDKRILKQTVIASVFFIVIAVPVYFRFFDRPAAPPPAPAIGPPEILLQKLFKVDEFDYDFLVQIRNPNVYFGASNVVYEFRLFDAAGQTVFAKKGATFLLPGQTRHEIISPLRPAASAAGFDFRVIEADWQKADQFVSPGLLSVKNQPYSEVKEPERGYSKISGSISNDSNFDFEKVDVYVVLFDDRNDPIAVGKTDIRTMLAKTERFFEVKWFKPFAGSVSGLEINPYTNVLRNDNFIKEHGGQEKFQKFY